MEGLVGKLEGKRKLEDPGADWNMLQQILRKVLQERELD